MVEEYSSYNVMRPVRDGSGISKYEQLALVTKNYSSPTVHVLKSHLSAARMAAAEFTAEHKQEVEVKVEDASFLEV